MYKNIIFPAGFAGQKVFNKDPTTWPDEARSTPKYICKYMKILWLQIVNEQYTFLPQNYSATEIGQKFCMIKKYTNKK